MEVEGVNREELDSRKKATVITIAVNVLVVVAIYFIVVWKPPVPPMSQYGLELNLGFTDVGSGNNQTETAPSESEQINTETPAPGTPTEQVSEPVPPVAQPETQPVAKPKPTESKSSYETKSNVASPIKGAEKTTEAVKESNQPKQESQPVTQPAEAEEKKAEEKVEEKPKIDQRAIFGAGGNKGKSSQSSAGSNQGSSNERGDEGNPEGTIDGRSLYQSGKGNAGDGSGYNLDLAGWDVASKPQINDRVAKNNGKLTFKIRVDDNGRVVSAIPYEYNLPNEVKEYYRELLYKFSFKKTGSNPTAEYSEGKITFIIKVD